MERAGLAVPALHDELDDLKSLVATDAEYVTVWANRPGPTPEQIEARVRAELTAVPGRYRGSRGEQLAAALRDTLRVANGAAVVLNDRVMLAEPLPEPVRREITLSGAVPALAPVIEGRQRDVPVVVVRIDRRGADIAWAGRHRSGSVSVDGEDNFITKVHAGGWSHASYQRTAENAWEQTAHDVAVALERVVAATDARTVMLAADVRMEELLRKSVASSVHDKFRAVSGGRGDDGSAQHRLEDIERWLRTAAAEDTRAVLEAFDAQFGQLDALAVAGAGDTFAALRAAQVDVLLVNDGIDHEPPAYFDAGDPMAVGLSEAEVRGGAGARIARRCDVAIRTALLTGAGVRVVPRGNKLTDGLGALLRWPGRTNQS